MSVTGSLTDSAQHLNEVRAAQRRHRLGTALHALAKDLARERRRAAQLERENARLREELERAGLSPD